MLIRPASPDDSDVMTALHAEGFAHYWDASAFNQFFATSGTLAWIAEIPDGQGQQPVGMLVMRGQFEQSDIITIVVRPAFRRHGIARALLQCAMDAAAAQGAERMFLDVEDGNAAAIRLYQGFGFTQIDRRKLYYRQKDGSYTDALVMMKQLPVASGQMTV